ncbi:MAG: hypothetical protein F6J94_06595 [Moorea sp. SIO1F2]|uniref:DUF5908 family protein n=1 Tax=Moorena TaxID=1155738 RepID=UPI0013BB80CB|nr:MULTISPECIES: DUF5908 family protein [unclassified Moorena]NEO00300.1 hypothetical protein [Moorena sp. SIO3I7]NEO04609.1 hypothetical protein [Moorena sp. SIO3I8]NET81635.1 hypothetical protein [Moorena sp. SIO1F2]
MPVEIKELIIRANIVDNSESKHGNSENGHSYDNTLAPQMGENYEQKGEIIAACVAQVLKILERKKER